MMRVFFVGRCVLDAWLYLIAGKCLVKKIYLKKLRFPLGRIDNNKFLYLLIFTSYNSLYLKALIYGCM